MCECKELNWVQFVKMKIFARCPSVVAQVKDFPASRRWSWTAALTSMWRLFRSFCMRWMCRSSDLRCTRESDSFFIAWSSASTPIFCRSFQWRCTVCWSRPTSESSTTSFHSLIKSYKSLRFTDCFHLNKWCYNLVNYYWWITDVKLFLSIFNAVHFQPTSCSSAVGWVMERTSLSNSSRKFSFWRPCLNWKMKIVVAGGLWFVRDLGAI